MTAESLCGRNAVQLSPVAAAPCDLAAEAARLATRGKILTQNKFLLKIQADGAEASLFPDGRVIVWETSDVDAAMEFYRKVFGA